MSACINCRTLERIRALTRVVQGAAPPTADLANGAVRFGPFSVGALVRIKTGFCGDDTAVPPAPFGVFYAIGDAEVAAVAAGLRCYPLGAFQWEDVEITQDRSYISIILDSYSNVGTALAEITDIIRKDGGPSGYGP